MRSLSLEALFQTLEVDDVVAETLGHRDYDLRRLRSLLGRLLDKFVVALNARLVLGLARLGRSGDPFLLALERPLARLFFAALLLEALVLLAEPGRVVALIRDAAAAIELEDPARDIVEEVAVVGDDEDRARILPQMPLEPGGRLGVEMVGGLVEQQQLGLLQNSGSVPIKSARLSAIVFSLARRASCSAAAVGSGRSFPFDSALPSFSRSLPWMSPKLPAEISVIRCRSGKGPLRRSPSWLSAPSRRNAASAGGMPSRSCG